MICFILSTALFASVVLLDPNDPSYQGLLLADTAVVVPSALLTIITFPIGLSIILYLTIWRSTRNKLINKRLSQKLYFVCYCIN